MKIPASPEGIRALVPAAYREKHQFPKYNTRPSVLSATTTSAAAKLLMRYAAPGLTREQHLERQAHFSELNRALGDEWGKEVEMAAMETFGRPLRFEEYRVSGIARDEFSEERKERLRALAHTQGECCAASLAHGHVARLTQTQIASRGPAF